MSQQEASQPCLIQMQEDAEKNLVLGEFWVFLIYFLCDVACTCILCGCSGGGCAFPESLAPICNLCGDDICVQTCGAAGSSEATEMRGLATTRRSTRGDHVVGDGLSGICLALRRSTRLGKFPSQDIGHNCFLA
ncbi:hypothetical protein GWK47_007290 [Chionoecetes opilio]|uniref:Uncharacterized protein n=1 Tax=Chionoecetes opilio TaxID=41210 RepID=A0A8J4Y2S3_CHIOP|nr:hypothetical protein GWK47_007290 [Chionoecetes opilio]